MSLSYETPPPRFATQDPVGHAALFPYYRRGGVFNLSYEIGEMSQRDRGVLFVNDTPNPITSLLMGRTGYGDAAKYATLQVKCGAIG